jgi:membrane fusion protein (multidrug efflux system)
METKQNIAEEAPKKKNSRFLIILAALIIGGGTWGFTKYNHGLHHEETDDAQIDADISPVIPRISGYVTAIKVKDNQFVKKGDTLIVLDNRDQIIKLEQAQGGLLPVRKEAWSLPMPLPMHLRRAALLMKRHVSIVAAQIEEAKVNVWRANQDFATI